MREARARRGRGRAQVAISTVPTLAAQASLRNTRAAKRLRAGGSVLDRSDRFRVDPAVESVSRTSCP